MSAKTATKTPLVPGVTTNYAVKKANISFPPRTMRRALQRNGALRQTYDAPVAAAAVPEYAFVQLLFHAACAAGDKTTITPKHLRAARDKDPELAKLFPGCFVVPAEHHHKRQRKSKEGAANGKGGAEEKQEEGGAEDKQESEEGEEN